MRDMFNAFSFALGEKTGEKTAIGEVLVGITKNPEDVSAQVGETVSFSVAAVGEGISYQWQYYTGKSWQSTGAEGNKTPQIELEATDERNGNKYRCVISNAGATINSRAATLTVIESE